MHLNCEETDYDGGDCNQQRAWIFDCIGQASYASRLGDGICDDGNEPPYFIDFACEDYHFDAGDCTTDSADIQESISHPEVDITFLDGDALDRSGNSHLVIKNGNAFVSRYGAQFDGDGDDISIANFDYARDGSFTMSLWFTKENCTDGVYEYLFSHHHNDDGPTTWEYSYVDMYLACESHPGGGWSTLEGTILRYWLRDTAGQEAAMDYSLHDAGSFDRITNVWVHTMLVVSPTSLQTFDDGTRVQDNLYGYYTSNPGNLANPTPGQLRRSFVEGRTTFDLRTDIFLGGRVDRNEDRHFHGHLALFRLYTGELGPTEALDVFLDGSGALRAAMLDTHLIAPSESSAQQCSCIFPFTYNGRTYAGCTDTDHTQLWCPLAVDEFGVYRSGGEYGDCMDVCPQPCMKSDDCDQQHYCAKAGDRPPICTPCHMCAGKLDAIEDECPAKCDEATPWDNELVPDCEGNYAPVTWLGDGQCDDGLYEYFGRIVHLSCAATDYDGGDCTNAVTYISDCYGQPAPESMLGDGQCDDGENIHNDHHIDLDCATHQFDRGDLLHRNAVAFSTSSHDVYMFCACLCVGDCSVHASPHIDVVATDGVELHTTYRLMVDLVNSARNIYTIYGSADDNMILPAAFHHPVPFGSNIGAVNPIFFEFEPASEYDSWLALGINSARPAAIGVDFPSWTQETPLVVSNGALFLMDPDTGPTGSDIVLAQLTIPSDVTWTAQFGVQGRSHGERTVSSDYNDPHVLFTNAPRSGKCERTYIGLPSENPVIRYVDVFVQDHAGICHLSMDLLAASCREYFDSCLEVLARQESRPSEIGQQCSAMFLGPDIGWNFVQAVDPSDGLCKTSMDLLRQLCQDNVDECITYLSVGNNTSASTIHLGSGIVTEELWMLTTSEQSQVLEPGSLSQRLFVAELREDIAEALHLPYEHTAIDYIDGGPALGPHGRVGLHGTVQVFVSMQIAGEDINSVNKTIEDIIAAIMTDQTQTVQGATLQAARIRRSGFPIEAAGRAHSELFDCDPIYLGRAFGVVNIRERAADGRCYMPAGHLEELCGDLLNECLAYMEATTDTDQATLPSTCLCTFPFTYKGRQYNEGCIMHGHDQPWCATDVNEDRTLDWGPDDEGPPPAGSTTAWGICSVVCPSRCDQHSDCSAGEYCAEFRDRRRQLWLNDLVHQTAPPPQCMPCHVCISNQDALDGGDCPENCHRNTVWEIVEVQDCDGRQAPTAWLGDGICDDGSHACKLSTALSNPKVSSTESRNSLSLPLSIQSDIGHLVDLNCLEHGNDGGDCSAAQSVITDCSGNSVPADYLGDGICDNGITQHR
eukprot:SAG31_NODE_2_length_46263_cov_45.908043_19_plen_1319_part_00